MINININDIDWQFFEECNGFSTQNPSNYSPVGTYVSNSDHMRKCQNGAILHPEVIVTKTNKNKVKWINETCPKCKGSGFLPKRELEDFVKLFEVAMKFKDPNVKLINGISDIPHQFKPRDPYDY